MSVLEKSITEKSLETQLATLLTDLYIFVLAFEMIKQIGSIFHLITVVRSGCISADMSHKRVSL